MFCFNELYMFLPDFNRVLIELIMQFFNLLTNKTLDNELRGISIVFVWDTWYKNILHHLVQLKTFLESDYYYMWIISLFLFLFFSSWWSSFQHIIMRCNDEYGAGRIRNSTQTKSFCDEKNVLLIKAYTLNVNHNGRLFNVA